MDEGPGAATGNKPVASSGKKLLARITTTEFWSVEFPGLLDPWAPQLANSFAEDSWLAPWPKVAAVGPVAVAAIGFLVPWVSPIMRDLYTESVILLIVATASATLNWSLGAGLLLG